MKPVKSRNNTSFPEKTLTALKNLESRESDFLRYHQRIIVEYMKAKSSIRGILLYHEMGSGKTMLGVSVCEAVRKLNPNKEIIFISPKSLHENFKKEFHKYAEVNKDSGISDIDKHINKNYSFISLNASNMLTQVKRAISDASLIELPELKLQEDKTELYSSLDNKIVIWDEFHNFLNSVANGSKNAVGFYDLVMSAKNIDLIALTGTPIVNDPYEIALGFNMLAGNIAQGKNSYYTLFGEDYSDFQKYFIKFTKSRDKIKNKDKFQDRIYGLVSYYGADTKEFQGLFPVEYELVVKRVPMSPKQFASYTTAREKELEEASRSGTVNVKKRLQKPSGLSSSYRVRSRQLSNFLYPKSASEFYRDEAGILRYKTFPEKLKDSDLSKESLKTYSPKLLEILTCVSEHLPENILTDFKASKKHLEKMIKIRTEINKSQLEQINEKTYSFGIGPGLIYSQFLGSGITLLVKILKLAGLTEVFTVGDAEDYYKTENKSGSFAVISGNVDSELRGELVTAFNSEKNINAEMISVIIVSSTGAEGISLNHGRHLHIMEPYWHWSRIRQVITRIVRFKSHFNLPRNQQTVQAYIYLSDYPVSEIKTKEKDSLITKEDTTDISLFKSALNKQFLINDFLLAVKEVSIDCGIHYADSDKINCRICAPDNNPLFSESLDRDMTQPSNCIEKKTEKITAKTITLDSSFDESKDESKELEFKYIITPDSQIRIFEFSPEINSYTEIFGNHEFYDSLYFKIKKKEKL